MKKFLKILGPGLLYAGAAVGVSHLVQATKAGAMFNYDLIWVLILANVLKYPFFEYGPRYALATKTSIIDGYNSVGKWAVALYGAITLFSMFILQAGVTVVTVGLIAYVFNIDINLNVLTSVLLVLCALFIMFGRFTLLDKLMKIIIVVLTLSTIIAVFSALGINKTVTPDALTHITWTSQADLLFLIAFIGWMPAPIDVSVWSSMWTVAKAKENGSSPTLKEGLFEFNVGYIGTAVLALFFLLIGAFVVYGTGEKLSPDSLTFSSQLIHMYTTSLGSWAYWIVSIAAVATMVSTTITLLDAYPRVLTPVFTHLFLSDDSSANEYKQRWVVMTILVAGTIFIMTYTMKSMGAMVNFATTLSFLTAPVLAWLNYKVVTDKHMPREAMPGTFMRILSWVGIVFFASFSIIYIYWFLL